MEIIKAKAVKTVKVTNKSGRPCLVVNENHMVTALTYNYRDALDIAARMSEVNGVNYIIYELTDYSELNHGPDRASIIEIKGGQPC